MRRLLAQHAPIAARMIHVKTTRGAPLSSLALCKPIQFVCRACTPFRAVPEVPTSGSLNKVNKRREGDGFFSRFLLVLPSLLPFWIFLMLNLWNFIQRDENWVERKWTRENWSIGIFCREKDLCVPLSIQSEKFDIYVYIDENLFRCRECCYVGCSKSKVLNEKIILKYFYNTISLCRFEFITILFFN